VEIVEELFTGKLVCLRAPEPQIVAETFNRWQRDSEYWRLLANDAAYPYSVKAIKEHFEKALLKEPPEFYMFLIYTLEEGRLIGEVGLDAPQWEHGDAFIGIGLGERDYWGKGYGSEAMRLIVRFAFNELNLERVSLSVFDYNPRAIRSYEKVGFKEEGRERGFLYRDGGRADLIFMGILRDEWQFNE
jgi:RimJ/RimL family protein N-acetyltransferase